MKSSPFEAGRNTAQATTPKPIIEHIIAHINEPRAKRHQERLNFQERYMANLAVIGDELYMMVEVTDDPGDNEPDDYNLATIKALDLPFTTEFEKLTAPSILSDIIASQRGNLLIGVPLEAIWDLDRSLRPEVPATATEQLLGAIAVYGSPTRT